jgi:hypothetical protein
MGSWENALESSTIDLSGYIKVNWARIDSNGRIIRNSNNLIDRVTTLGLLVEKYLNRSMKKIDYIINTGTIIKKALVTEDGFLFFDIDGKYILIEGF